MFVPRLIIAFFLLSATGCAEFQLFPQRNAPTPTNPVQVLQEELNGGGKVTLGVVVENISNVLLPANSDVYKTWAAGNSRLLVTRQENALLQYFAKYENFKLIDRSTINKIAEEHVLQMSGATKSIDVIKLGELLNATHLYIITYGRYPYNGFYYRWVDTLQVRVLRVQDGRVLTANEDKFYGR